ncbi:hypothetical protein EDB86DRAFT_1607901 [Lactarius hatsudake]|nr:hypothetical protein EDB86DRAFT_1607901 [Lactarius hatsudake]
MTRRGRPTSNSRSVITKLTVPVLFTSVGLSFDPNHEFRSNGANSRRNAARSTRRVACSSALEFFGDEEEQVEKAQAVFGVFAGTETRLGHSSPSHSPTREPELGERSIRC